MNFLVQAVKFLNPGQIVVVGFYQPLYALAKRTQWNQHTLYGKKSGSYVCCFTH